MYGRIHYAGLTVRGTGPDITAIRLSGLAILQTNRQIALNNDNWLVSIVWLNALPCHGRDQGFKSPTSRQVYARESTLSSQLRAVRR